MHNDKRGAVQEVYSCNIIRLSVYMYSTVWPTNTHLV